MLPLRQVWPVATAAITAINVATNVSRTANAQSDGPYSLSLLFLPIGEYRIEISAPGFKKFEQTGIILEVNRNARVDAVMQVGAVENVDMTIARTFRIRERMSLQFRGEATNAFNIVNLMNPGTNANSTSTFGKITSARPMRQAQLGLTLRVLRFELALRFYYH